MGHASRCSWARGGYRVQRQCVSTQLRCTEGGQWQVSEEMHHVYLVQFRGQKAFYGILPVSSPYELSGDKMSKDIQR